MNNYFVVTLVLFFFFSARVQFQFLNRIAIRSRWGILRVVFVVGLILPATSTFGQSISPQTVNVGGNYSTVSGFSLDYSLGESASIALFKFSDNSSLSTGVLQSFTPLVTGITNLSFTEGESITVSPNPASQNLRIKGLLNRPGFIEFHLVDVNGRVMSIDPRSYCINYFDKEFNVSSFNEGVYFIRLMYQSMDSDTKSAVFKFIKIQ